jgi:hypothetical protein
VFNYLFPIFCFGLVITGIVYLGILEASKQVKAECENDREPANRDDLLNTASSRNHQPKGQSPRFTVRSINE